MRLIHTLKSLTITLVSIHASVKDATYANNERANLANVSIHASVKDATLCRWCSRSRQKCFNPRICKRCDSDIEHCYLLNSVSIHASVKDATIKISAYPFRAYVSIHASVKDATRSCHGRRRILDSFNPRICKRCDLECEEFARRVRVSIHASVKDATKYTKWALANRAFQSTHL